MKLKNILIPILAATVFASCEEVVDLEVKNAEPRYVVEGIVTNEDGAAIVKISKTQSLNAPNKFEGISGADVLIKNDGGNIIALNEVAKGEYAANLQGVPGTTYTLEVRLGDQRFWANCTMPAPVSIDSLFVSEFDMMDETTLQPNVVFNDPPGKGNSYRFVQYHNGKRSKYLFVMDDELSDGRLNTTTLYQSPDDDADKIKKGDHITIELQATDQKIYKYWYSMQRGSLGEDGAASPANPVSNMQGGALGYFSAHAVTRKDLVVD